MPLNWFETYLTRGEESVSVHIEGHQVTVTRSVHKPTSQTYKNIEQSWCIFEANIEALKREGFVEFGNRCADEAPGALDGFTPFEANELYSVQWVDGYLKRVSIDAADPVALWDGTLLLLQKAKELDGFDKKKFDPVWEVDHALRRLLHHPRADQMSCFELFTLFEHDRIRIAQARSTLRTLAEHGVARLCIARAVPRCTAQLCSLQQSWNVET